MAAIIFDFDGTIADSWEYFIDFLAREAKRFPLTDSEKEEFKGLPLVPAARKMGFPVWQLPRLYFQGRKRMDKVIHQIKPFAGMPEAVEKLHAEGHELFILSSNSVRNIRRFLKHYKLRHLFVEVYGGMSLRGKSVTINKLMKNNNLTDKKNTYYVGDEIRDVVAAKESGIRCVAVTWGFCTHQTLSGLKPTAVVDNPNSIITVFEDVN